MTPQKAVQALQKKGYSLREIEKMLKGKISYSTLSRISAVEEHNLTHDKALAIIKLNDKSPRKAK